jgi:hypothetical protein
MKQQWPLSYWSKLGKERACLRRVSVYNLDSVPSLAIDIICVWYHYFSHLMASSGARISLVLYRTCYRSDTKF